MKSDYLKELGYLGVTARLKRLTDIINSNIKDLYKARDFDIEPSWHLVFLMLRRKEQCTMSEIADAFQMSQPAVTKMIARMIKKNYVIVSADIEDGRKKILRLSRKAKQRLPRFEKVWSAGKDSVCEILASNKYFLESLEKLEKEIRNKSFVERALDRLKDE